MSLTETPLPSVPRTVAGYDNTSRLTIESWPVSDPAVQSEGCITVSGTHPGIILALDRRDVNLAILHRDVPDDLTGPGLAPLLAAGPFIATAKGKPSSIPIQLARRLPALVPGEFLQDIEDLAGLFSMIDLWRGIVRVRLQVFSHTDDPSWRTGSFGLRMLCTYRGLGTEWLSLPGGAAAAEKLSSVNPPVPIGQIPIGAGAVLKGEGHPDAKGAACIHRSPSGCSGMGARLVLRIDQPDWDSDE
ncbi:MAG: DUF1826 domain-containing protein [Proteobacteria bacterium]|nr:DUF1826 domain-containing protein [Pseudomonadota bacterium]